MKYYFLQFTFLIISLNLIAQNSNKRKEWKEAISEITAKELKNSGTPSLQIAIAYRDSLIFEQAYGFADLENNIPATSETKYRSASVSKWWTATTAMILAHQGMLDLDAPIQNYCLDFPDKKWPITTRQLLTHTAGIRSYIDLDEELSRAQSNEDSLIVKERYRLELLGKFTHYTEINESLKNFKNDSLLFRPGTDWSYSSQGYRILGCVLEGASGMSYRELTRQLIFQATNMMNTVEDDAWSIIHKRVSGYRLQRGKPIRRADIRDVSENLPAGGHLTTASDLVRFATAFSNEKFFSSKTINLMSTAYFMNSKVSENSPSWRDAIPSKEKYGYGIMLFPDHKSRRYGHTGRQAGGSSIVMVVPDKNITIAILTNSKGWNGYISFIKAIEEIVVENYKQID